MQHELYIANRIKVRTLFKFDFGGNRYTLLQNQKNWPSQFPNDADRMPQFTQLKVKDISTLFDPVQVKKTTPLLP